MNSLEKLTENQLQERKQFDDAKKRELEMLRKKQSVELAKQGASTSITLKHEEEWRTLSQQHSQEGQALYDRHHKQYQAERDFIEPKKNYEVDIAKLDGAALTAQRREEAENMKNNWEASKQEDRQSLIDKLKDRWGKNQDLDRGR